jgi:hypothetical protein
VARCDRTTCARRGLGTWDQERGAVLGYKHCGMRSSRTALRGSRQRLPDVGFSSDLAHTRLRRVWGMIEQILTGT